MPHYDYFEATRRARALQSAAFWRLMKLLDRALRRALLALVRAPKRGMRLAASVRSGAADPSAVAKSRRA
jgi:hypothetical protein